MERFALIFAGAFPRLVKAETKLVQGISRNLGTFPTLYGYGFGFVLSSIL